MTSRALYRSVTGLYYKVLLIIRMFNIRMNQSDFSLTWICYDWLEMIVASTLFNHAFVWWTFSTYVRTLRAVGFSYAKRERKLVSPTPNERETTASNRLLFHRACASSSRLTWCIWCQVHLSIIFSLEVFRYKRIKMYLTQSAKERFNSHCIFAIILRKWLRCFNEKKRYFFTTSMFDER